MTSSILKNRLSSPWLALILITLLAAIIYSNIYQSPFVFDDIYSIVENRAIRDVSNFLDLKQLLKPRPVVDLTFALNYKFGKLDVFGYHLVNILIHIINGFVAYFLALAILRLLFRPSGAGEEAESSKLKGQREEGKAQSSKLKAQRKRGKVKKGEAAGGVSQFSIFPDESGFAQYSNNFQTSIPMISLFAALIFIVHPLQTQAVTYTIQRYASLAAMFYMGSVLFYLKARMFQQRAKGEAQSPKLPSFSLQPSAFYVLCIICGMLAFLSKQNTASLPAAIILVEYLFIDRTWQGWKKKILWFTPAFILFAILVLYVSGFFSGTIQGRGLLEDVSDLMRETGLVSRWSYLCTQFNVLVIYIRLLFLPIGQNLDYVYPFKSGFFDAYTPLAFLFLSGIAVLGIWKRKGQPIITLAIFWFFITLSVESSIIPIRDALFEHRLYLPMFGFALIVSYLLFHFLSKKRLWAIVICVSVIVSLGAATYLRNRIWQDGITLWSDVLSKVPQSIRAHNNLGSALTRQARFKEAMSHFSKVLRAIPENAKAHYNQGVALAGQGDLEKAIRHYSEALRIKPDYAKAHYNLGNILEKQGSFKEAIRHYSEALRIKPDDTETRNNLAVALARQGSFKEAMSHFSEVLRADPENAKARYNVGSILEGQGRIKEAMSHFSEAVRIKPDYAKAHYNLGNILEKQGSFKEAIRHYSEALRIKPDDTETRNNLAVALARQGGFKEAVSHFSEVLQKDPENAKVHYNLGGVLKQQGNLEDAIHHFSEAVRIKPDYAKAHHNLGIILARQGNFEKAISHYSEAIRLNPDFSAVVYYNIACVYARQNKIEESIDWLKKAIKSGYKNWDLLKTDKDLENIRGSSYYKEIVEGLGD